MAQIERCSSETAENARVALVLPGAGYTAQAPLLYWPVLSLMQAGWDVWSINWHADLRDAQQQGLQGFVEDALTQARKEMPAEPEVVIGKSLGTYALPYFVDSDKRAAWLTPILTDPEVAAAARSASSHHLLAGGSSDESWEPDLVHGTQARVIILASGNHSLETQGAGWRESAVNQLDLIHEVISHLTCPR